MLLLSLFQGGGYTEICQLERSMYGEAFNELAVKRAFAPEFFNWKMSSAAEYAAFAGDTTPESRCTAYDKVIVSTYEVSQCRRLQSACALREALDIPC